LRKLVNFLKKYIIPFQSPWKVLQRIKWLDLVDSMLDCILEVTAILIQSISATKSLKAAHYSSYSMQLTFLLQLDFPIFFPNLSITCFWIRFNSNYPFSDQTFLISLLLLNQKFLVILSRMSAIEYFQFQIAT